MIPEHWVKTRYGWLRIDGLLLETNVRLEEGAPPEEAFPVAGWCVGVDRGAPDGDGLDVRYPDLGADETPWPPLRSERAMTMCNEKWPYCADIAAKLPPKKHWRLTPRQGGA